MNFLTDKMREAMGYDTDGNAPSLLAEVDRRAMDAGKIHRVAGEARCPACQCVYRLHPPVQGALWATRGCLELVKL